MLKKTILYFVVVVLIVASGSLTHAQKSGTVNPGDSQTEQKSIVKDHPLQTYLDISSLQMQKRLGVFSKLSNDDKADLFRLHLALQLVKRPNLSVDQQSLILDAILSTSPDIYDRTKDKTISENFTRSIEARAGTIFSQKETFEIFASLGGKQSDIEIFQKYVDVTASPFSVKRRQSFSKRSPQDKSDVFRTHLAIQMAKRSLERRQMDFLLEAIRMASADLYAAAKGSPEKIKGEAALDDLGSRILDYFSKKEGIEIFLSLGGDDGGFEPEAGLCSCSTESDYCSWWRSNTRCGGSGVI